VTPRQKSLLVRPVVDAVGVLKTIGVICRMTSVGDAWRDAVGSASGCTAGDSHER
jgi:hypothetical protein